VSTPRIVDYGHSGPRLEDDPHGVASELVTALLSNVGSRWVAELVRGDAIRVQLGPRLHAQRPAAPVRSWTLTRTDTGATLEMSADQIDQLVRLAWDFRRMYWMENFPLGSALAGGRYEVRELLHGGADRGMYRGVDHQNGGSVLVTIGTTQRERHEHLLRKLGYGVPGIAELLHIGPLTDGEHTGMVEAEPSGVPVSTLRSPLAPVQAVRWALALARIAAEAHARGHVLVGLRPELVYVDGDAFTGVAPRCEPFLATSERRDYGVAPCFDQFFMAPEVLSHPDEPPSPAADVFSLSAILALWLTGEHPFEGEGMLQAMAISAGQRRALEIALRFRPVLENGLAPREARMTLDQLIDTLVELG
jgi:hypothetical protein